MLGSQIRPYDAQSAVELQGLLNPGMVRPEFEEQAGAAIPSSPATHAAAIQNTFEDMRDSPAGM
jgi:hypothetical protein